MNKVKLATVWLDGCSGCHMSLLDMDAAIIDLVQKVDIVYGPLVDAQEFPEGVDATLVEGAVSSQEDVIKIQKIRERTRVLIALGDCAVTSNVPGMRNTIPVSRLLQRVYVEGSQEGRLVPTVGVPPLMKQARPVHDYVKVDIHVPGCPPSAAAIVGVVTDLLEGRKPASNPKVKFG
jgi:NAD-reducing hydrogenase small subunit